ncbi:MAG: hypothetical protein EAZ78_19700 [Oscillatoriales cyanobacterium]|uniref:hypothetical protein n=1 Tax=Microcoleus anatoxicus TaxID=2705319 RepID=UPI0029736475|nr:MAG: hypothetical protein EA000_25720 [Oscillatoriales cyanobacterium]TAE03714.1 MAG: hypothetical protein EAZ96_12060 [Oscillatoriales cyanobacterium]TAF00791.1 MAG: hypothetical protein EAZ78_19700 [Oscillatoriales cyanobacterium]TAF70551.1 MAG: hypothetical protein EAZ59_04265 [Oscillatoriales cyanobacterium]
MKRISEINPLGEERRNPSEEKREELRRERLQRERNAGYQMLVELCDLGEYDMAQQLANRNFNWGYEIVDGIVMERMD